LKSFNYYFYGNEPAVLDCLTQKGSFLLASLEQGDRKLGRDQLQRQAGKARTGSNVKERTVQLHHAAEVERFAEQAPHNGPRLADSGQVDPPIPVEKEVEVPA
jgi:hypothetical protein